MIAEDISHAESLRSIARWLSTPALSGLYLSSRDLERIGGEIGVHGLPRARRHAIEQLFRSAAVDGQVEALLERLEREAGEHIAAYRECDTPALTPWEHRAAVTVTRLAEMRAASAG